MAIAVACEKIVPVTKRGENNLIVGRWRVGRRDERPEPVYQAFGEGVESQRVKTTRQSGITTRSNAILEIFRGITLKTDGENSLRCSAEPCR